MPSIFDFSDAYAWLMFGFLAGLIAYWLYRRLFGGHHHYAAQLADLSAQLDASNQQLAASGTTHASELANLNQIVDNEQSKSKYYEGEYNTLLPVYNSLLQSYNALSQDTSSGSALVKKLQQDYAIACKEAGEAAQLRSDLESARAAANKMQAEAKSLLASVEAAYKEEIGSLKIELNAAKHNTGGNAAALTGELATAKAEISRLQGELSAAANASGEVSWLKGEVTRLTNELANFKSGATMDFKAVMEENEGLKASLAKAAANERTAAMEHHATKNDLLQVRTALEETSLIGAERHAELERLKVQLATMPADLENYRRFKDALDAANCIAAGLPDKA